MSSNSAYDFRNQRRQRPEGDGEAERDAVALILLRRQGGATGLAVVAPVEKGAEGVKETIERITAELKGAMARTGCADLKHMDDSVIRRIR